jgi:hypothetical protein
VDDYRVPRALKHLVTGPQDLPALAYLLIPPTAEDKAAFHEESARAQAFARQRGVLLVGGWGVGADMLNWLCGMEQLMTLTHEQPGFVADLFEMVHAWNKQRMGVVLSGGVDLYIRRAWYEGCDFIPRRFYREVVLPRLKAEVNLAHDKGAKFGYICTMCTLGPQNFILSPVDNITIEHPSRHRRASPRCGSAKPLFQP